MSTSCTAFYEAGTATITTIVKVSSGGTTCLLLFAGTAISLIVAGVELPKYRFLAWIGAGVTLYRRLDTISFQA